jgi:hypothetical protein
MRTNKGILLTACGADMVEEMMQEEIEGNVDGLSSKGIQYGSNSFYMCEFNGAKVHSEA